jgi:hypothetical protein
VTQPVPWIASYAARAGFRYEPEADERWMRVWEPYATLKIPVRYEHALYVTGTVGSLTIARFVLQATQPRLPNAPEPRGPEAWIVIAQDERLGARAAATSDVGGVFGEPLDLVPMRRMQTGDAAFDHVFASFAESREALAEAITPSLRKLALSWRTPVHFEIRRGGFVLAPVALPPDPRALAWLVDAAQFFGAKAAKRR